MSQLRYASHHVIIGCDQQNFRNIISPHPFINFFCVLFGVFRLFSQNDANIRNRFFGHDILQYRFFINSGYENVLHFTGFRQTECISDAIVFSGEHSHIIKTTVAIMSVGKNAQHKYSEDSRRENNRPAKNHPRIH
jgi:hypothetical protein